MCANGNGQRLPLPHNDDEAFAARDGGIDEVPGEHRIVLGRQRDDDGGILRKRFDAPTSRNARG